MPCVLKKKLDSLCKDNYCSVNLFYLIVFSKLFERIMAEQLTIYFENILSPKLSAYRRGYSCQHVILNLTEYWRKALDDNQNVGTIGLDLSKAFDCMPHGLLLTKLYAYGAYLYLHILKIACNGLKLWALAVTGPRSIGEFHKALYWVHCSLISFWMTCFICPLIVLLWIMLTITISATPIKNLDVLQKELESDFARAVQWFAEKKTNGELWQVPKYSVISAQYWNFHYQYW